MAATLAQLRAGLETRLKTIDGLRTSAYWPAQVNPPMAWVKPVLMAERDAIRGSRRPTFDVWLALSEATPLPEGQAALDLYLDEEGPSSILAALEGDPTLGGLVSALDLTWADYDQVEVGGTTYYGARFIVVVWPET